MSRLMKIMQKARSAFLFGAGGFIRRFIPKPLPRHPQGKVLIHIGCGDLDNDKFINVDCRPGWHIDRIGTIEECSSLFPPGYADLIYACHVLEHVSHQRLMKTLRGLRVCLKTGGILRLSVPDFETMVLMYKEQKDINAILAPLMGGQGYPANFHCSVFNESYLRDLLAQSGFRETRRWDPAEVCDHGFDDWAGRTISLYGREWPISLNIEAIK